MPDGFMPINLLISTGSDDTRVLDVSKSRYKNGMIFLVIKLCLEILKEEAANG